MSVILKPQEFSIGNTVSHHDYTDETFTVESITKETHDGADFYIIDIKGGKNGRRVNNLDMIKPVRLSKCGLLEFLGFKLRSGRYHKDGISLKYDAYEESFKFVYRQPHSDFIHYTTMNFVHELQNLYFLLQKEELKYVKSRI
jgi:hypothetical protein